MDNPPTQKGGIAAAPLSILGGCLVQLRDRRLEEPEGQAYVEALGQCYRNAQHSASAAARNDGELDFGQVAHAGSNEVSGAAETIVTGKVDQRALYVLELCGHNPRRIRAPHKQVETVVCRIKDARRDCV
jgi:hypothetical protein